MLFVRNLNIIQSLQALSGDIYSFIFRLLSVGGQTSPLPACYASAVC